MGGSPRRTGARRRVAVLAAVILTLGLAVGGPATPAGQSGLSAHGHAVASPLVSSNEVGAPVTAPTAVQFSSVSYSLAESGGSAVIIVMRTGSSAGEVTVDYTTSDDSAMAPSDYMTTSGTITFGDGDTGDKTFNVAIVDNSLFEGDETVNLSLANPTGNAILGDPDEATLTVIEDDVDPEDVDRDGLVGPLDLRVVLTELGLPPFGNPWANVNGDNVVDVLDLAQVARNLGRAWPQPLRPMAVERAFPNLDFQQLTGLVQPDDGSDRIFVTEQTGLVRVFPNDQAVTQAGVFLDIQDRVSMSSSEEGLLGMAFDPGYETNGFLYVYYSNSSPRRSVLSRFSVSQNDPNVADPGSEYIIMEIAQPFSNHNGGQIVFGPDGYLYVALGDGGSGGDPQGNGQNVGTLLGSILRIDVSGPSDGKNYRIPADNPFVGVPGVREEIWAYGLRNPWRFSFDPDTGWLWVSDVGQASWEEIDTVEKGLNYGWNIMEGSSCYPPGTGCDPAGLELPLWEYSPADGCAIIGGHVHRSQSNPSLLAAYVYGDFCSGKIWGLRYDGQSVTEQMLLNDSSLFISSFGTDLARNLYILSYGMGIYRLAAAD